MTDTPELEHGDGHDVSPVGDIHSFPSDAELSRSLMASSAAGVLSTLTTEGYPYGSLVSHMVDGDGNPIILISDLAEHTKNARLDNRASLLVDTSRAADEDPLVGARLTLIGQMNLLAASDDLQATYSNQDALYHLLILNSCQQLLLHLQEAPLFLKHTHF